MKLPIKTKKLFVLIHDISMSMLAWVLAYSLRFNFEIPTTFQQSMWQNMAWVTPLQTLIFWRAGLYQGIWRFASLPDLKKIIAAALFAALAISTLLLIIQPETIVPRSVLILDPLLLIMMMGGSRFLYRSIKDNRLYRLHQLAGEPVIVLGAGQAAVSLLKDLDHSETWRVVGLLDDDPELHGRTLHDVRVFGPVDYLPALSKKLNAKHAIIAMPRMAHDYRKHATDIASRAGIKLMTVPTLDELMEGKVSVTKVRPVEIEDLLGRDPVNLDDSGLRGLLTGKQVMVTGAAGSIGSELCRQIAKYQPARLIFFDISEHGLYQLEQSFNELYKTQDIVCVIGDVRRRERVEWTLKRFRPDVVFHAAAYKHVPMLESENLSESLTNNVLGTRVLAESCKAGGVDEFVLISTDKAVNPTNAMGASKRMAEMVCQDLQESEGTKFVIVRFGNVLGSSGSVIPKFRDQIAKGGPITVTHPEITRYFMSIPEASQLVLQAALMGKGGEIFVLDMGQPVKIADLAKDMIRLSGLTEDQIKITYSGLRAGEKMYEELLADDEITMPTPHEKLRVATARPVEPEKLERMLAWLNTASGKDENEIRSQICLWVPEYRPAEGAPDIRAKVSSS